MLRLPCCCPPDHRDRPASHCCLRRCRRTRSRLGRRRSRDHHGSSHGACTCARRAGGMVVVAGLRRGRRRYACSACGQGLAASQRRGADHWRGIPRPVRRQCSLANRSPSIRSDRPLADRCRPRRHTPPRHAIDVELLSAPASWAAVLASNRQVNGPGPCAQRRSRRRLRGRLCAHRIHWSPAASDGTVAMAQESHCSWSSPFP